MTIRLDCTQYSVVAVCDQDPWRLVTTDRGAAWAAAAVHEATAHVGTHQARNAAQTHASRHGGISPV